jgi:hypothetical protein
MANKRKRKSAFVPRLLIPAAAAVSVVPACVLASCGGGTNTTSGTLGVFAVAYPAYEAGTDAPPDNFLGVFAVAYPAYEAGPG